MSTINPSDPISAPSESDSLPTFNNGITPLNAPPPPVVTELIPAVMPVSNAELNANSNPEQPYTPPVEAVPGVGGILGVQAEA